MKLITTQNAKTVKGEKLNYLTGIMYLKPNITGGYKNVCPSASKGCIASCLNTAGLGRTNCVQLARQRRTDLMFTDPDVFFDTLIKDINSLKVTAKNKGMTLCIRLNGTSDLPALARNVAKLFPDTQFYDYTKCPRPQKRTLPNYHLTFSRSEDNWNWCVDALENGINVAVVFRRIPKTFKGYRVIVGDDTDLRFLDKTGRKKGYIVGLTAKADAFHDKTGFVILN